MMKPGWALLAVLLFPPAFAAELLYVVDFGAPEVIAAVARCPWAKVEKDFEGTDVLTVTVPPDKGKATGTVGVLIPVDLGKIGAAGTVLRGEGEIAFREVTEPKYAYNGVKCMMMFQADGRMNYPDFTVAELPKRFGTRNWTRFSHDVSIPETASSATLALGLQDASGSVSFRNLRFYRAGDAPESTLKQKNIPQAKYTFERTPRRGVMSPNSFREEDFAELRKWGVNLIRWQVKANPVPYSFPAWAAMIGEKAKELSKVLDTAQKYGLKVAVDLHAKAGSQILETPEGHQFLIDFWTKVAKENAGHPALYGYDLLNEPHSRYLKPGDPGWPELAGRAIRAIREIDPETPIIVEADSMATPAQIEFLPVFDSPNIIYSIHMYHPGVLTHQLDPRKKPFIGYPDEHWTKESVFPDFLAKAVEFQKKTGARIFVGEFGCIRWAPGADRYLKDCIDVFEANGWDWAYHAFREFHGWSVEHSDDPDQPEPVETTARKEVLLKAFRKNKEEAKP